MWRRLSLVVALLCALAPDASASEHVLRGRIVDAEGKGVGGVEVSHAWTSDAGSMTALRSTKTAADGSFRFELERRSDTVDLLAYTSDRKRATRVHYAAPGSGQSIEATLLPCVDLKTKLMTQGGEFYAGRGVGWITPSAEGRVLVRVNPEKGACAVPLPPGDFVFHATSPGQTTLARAFRLDGKKAELDIGMFDLVDTEACVAKGSLAPPFQWADASPELLRLLEDQHFPNRWTLCYFWAHR